MTDYFYRFPDQQSAITALQPLGMTYTDPDGVEQISQGNHQFAAWGVGELQGYTGWHLNVRVIDESFDVSSLNQYIVHPTNPKCIWA